MELTYIKTTTCFEGAPLNTCTMIDEKQNTLELSSSLLIHPIFKLMDTRSVETGFLQGLRYANVSLTHSGVDTVRN